MSKENLFFGDSYSAVYAVEIYRQLMGRGEVTYKSVVKEYYSQKSCQMPSKLSCCDGYGELKKTFGLVIKAIEEAAGEGSVEVIGNNRCRSFRYVGEVDDPLSDMVNAKVINNLRQYWMFCQDSAGFFPQPWLDHFFKDCRDLLEMKARKSEGKRVISASVDRILENIDLLPELYGYIKGKTVLEIDYKPYEEEQVTLMFHPHFLKEYNGRWHLFGHAEDREPEFGYNIALDRIRSKPRERHKVKYIAPPARFYEQYFKDIVGVSRTKDSEVCDITVRAHSYYIYKLTETKPVHHTQCTVTQWGEHEDGTYGEFSMRVEVNNEFMGRILQMGDGLEVVSPAEVREKFRCRVQGMADLYRDK